jgi:hypothetical protein
MQSIETKTTVEDAGEPEGSLESRAKDKLSRDTEHPTVNPLTTKSKDSLFHNVSKEGNAGSVN